MPEKTEYSYRSLVALCLFLFLLFGFRDLVQYHASDWPWLGYLIAGLRLGIPILVFGANRVASLGVFRLTLYTGFLILLVHYVLDYFYGLNRFGMIDRLHGRWWLDVWPENLGWVKVVTCIALGAVVSRRKGLRLGIFASVFVAVADSALSWLVLIPGELDLFGVERASEIFQLIWPEVLRAAAFQASILASFGIMGALASEQTESESLRRLGRGVWLALFLLLGFWDIMAFIYFSHTFLLDSEPWLVFFLYSLIMGLPLLVIAYKQVAELGMAKLTVYTGFLLVFVHYLLDYWYKLDLLSIEVQLYENRWLEDWIEAWTENPNLAWVRIVTYISLGLIVAKHKASLGIATIVLAALADSILSWLVLITDTSYFRSQPHWVSLDSGWPQILAALVLQTSFFALLSLLTALASIARRAWPTYKRAARPATYKGV